MENTNYIEVTLNETVLKQLGYEVAHKKDEHSIESLCFKKDGEDVKALVIPSTYIYDSQKYKITKIGDSVFRGCLSLTSVTIPDSVTEIGSWAFSNCESLTSITIPNSVTEIGEEAFDNCESLTNITLPDNLTKISDYAFSGCDSLKSIIIPNSVTTIGKCSFSFCKLLKKLVIPNNVTIIDDCAFEYIDTVYYNGTTKGSTWGANKVINNKYNYIEVKLNKTVLKQLGYELEHENKGEWNQKLVSFKKNGEDVTDLVIPSIYNYKVQDYKIITIDHKTFAYCSSLISVKIFDGLIEIGGRAFEGCCNLIKVIIPNSVNIIGENAFENVPHIEYHGTATEAPWGAMSMN